MRLTETDFSHLRRCLELAEEALVAGDDPFGSVLVSATGRVLREDRNRSQSNNPTYHPEIELVHWAAEHLTLEERAATTMYTSGEHCPMCSAAHGWAKLGRIVYIASAEQFGAWLREFGIPSGPVNCLPIQKIAPHIEVIGPIPELLESIRQLHLARFGKK